MTGYRVSQPLMLENLELANRFVGLPIGLSGYVDQHGSPMEPLFDLYRRRAQGGVGLVIVEVSYIDPYPCSRPGLLGFYSDKLIPLFTRLTDVIHEGGARAAIQLTTRWHTDTPMQFSELSLSEVERSIDLYIQAAERALHSGFDAIELQGAHGWPMARAISPMCNARTDRYGGPVAYATTVVERVRQGVGTDFPILFRVSIDEGFGTEGITLELSRGVICPALETAGVDILDLSFGPVPIFREGKTYLAAEPIYFSPGARLAEVAEVKQAVTVPVIGRGRINDPAVAVRVIEEGLVDLVGLGRALLADPDFPRKTLEDHWDAIVRCIACDYCSERTVVRRQTLRCTVNYDLGREAAAERGLPPVSPGRKKSILVVGGGPAGMQAAVVLTERGHQVTLWEQGSQLGGLARQASVMPHVNLQDVGYIVDHLERQLQRLAVSVHCGCALMPERLPDLQADAVVLAVGGVAQPLAVPGTDTIAVHTLEAYLQGEAVLGSHVAVVGGKDGAEAALSITRSGKRVWLFEASETYANPPYRYGLRTQRALTDFLVEAEVTTVLQARVQALTAEGLQYVQNGKTAVLPVDSVVVGLGRMPNRGLAKTIRQHGIPCYEIGDGVRPRGLAEALEEAHIIGRRL